MLEDKNNHLTESIILEIDFSIYKPRKITSCNSERIKLMLPNGSFLVYSFVKKTAYIETDKIILDSHNNELIKEIEYMVLGYITDYIYTHDILCIVTDEGCYYEYSMKNNKITQSIMITESGLDSLYIFNDYLFLLESTGKLLIMNKNKIYQVGNHGSIWNFAISNKYIVSGGRDGIISFYCTKSNELIMSKKYSFGWINSVKYFKNRFVLVTSRGDLILLNSDGLLEDSINITKWINNFIEYENRIYLVTAQGFLECYDINKKSIINSIKISNSQLIDVIIIGLYLYIISVEGDIYIWSIENNLLMKHFCFPLKNFTSISNIEDIIFIAMMSGEIIVLNSKMFFQNEIIYKLYKISSARIWKIINYNDTIIGITNENEVFLIDVNHNILLLLSVKNRKTLFTSCVYSKFNESVIIGCSNGSILDLPIEKFIKEAKLVKCDATIKINKHSNKKNTQCLDNKIRLFVDDNINYSGRLIRILTNEHIEFILSKNKSELQKRLILQLSGWSRFPLFFWYGNYYGSGVLLTEMIKSGVLINNRGDNING